MSRARVTASAPSRLTRATLRSSVPEHWTEQVEGLGSNARLAVRTRSAWSPAPCSAMGQARRESARAQRLDPRHMTISRVGSRYAAAVPRRRSEAEGSEHIELGSHPGRFLDELPVCRDPRPAGRLVMACYPTHRVAIKSQIGNCGRARARIWKLTQRDFVPLPSECVNMHVARLLATSYACARGRARGSGVACSPDQANARLPCGTATAARVQQVDVTLGCTTPGRWAPRGLQMHTRYQRTSWPATGSHISRWPPRPPLGARRS